MRTLTNIIPVTLAALGLVSIVACSDDGAGPGGDGDIDASNPPVDDAGNPIVPDAAMPPTADAGPPAGCDPAAPRCNNCIDDDEDGDIDGFDIHCISAIDDDEESFATGISGDNMDMTWQDCFFDGNSGAGDDGCRYHYCCLLDDPCPNGGFDPVADCEITQECVDNCAPLAPPGCDCFGCCTICNRDGVCQDVVTNPAVAPECTTDANNNPINCPACTLSTECGTPCTPMGCSICPGQDLPPECMDQECPNDLTSCESNADCTAGNQFCSNGCCITQIG